MQFTATQKRASAWLLIALLAVLALWLLGPVLTPFVVAGVLAYALTPLVDRLDDLGRGRMPRLLAVVIVELLLIFALLGLVLLVVPILAKEVPLMREQLPLLFDKLNTVIGALAGAIRHQRGAGPGQPEGARRSNTSTPTTPARSPRCCPRSSWAAAWRSPWSATPC